VALLAAICAAAHEAAQKVGSHRPPYRAQRLRRWRRGLPQQQCHRRPPPRAQPPPAVCAAAHEVDERRQPRPPAAGPAAALEVEEEQQPLPRPLFAAHEVDEEREPRPPAACPAASPAAGVRRCRYQVPVSPRGACFIRWKRMLQGLITRKAGRGFRDGIRTPLNTRQRAGGACRAEPCGDVFENGGAVRRIHLSCWGAHRVLKSPKIEKHAIPDRRTRTRCV
jgi:hypothetical protein